MSTFSFLVSVARAFVSLTSTSSTKTKCRTIASVLLNQIQNWSYRHLHLTFFRKLKKAVDPTPRRRKRKLLSHKQKHLKTQSKRNRLRHHELHDQSIVVYYKLARTWIRIRLWCTQTRKNRLRHPELHDQSIVVHYMLTSMWTMRIHLWCTQRKRNRLSKHQELHDQSIVVHDMLTSMW